MYLLGIFETNYVQESSKETIPQKYTKTMNSTLLVQVWLSGESWNQIGTDWLQAVTLYLIDLDLKSVGASESRNWIHIELF